MSKGYTSPMWFNENTGTWLGGVYNEYRYHVKMISALDSTCVYTGYRGDELSDAVRWCEHHRAQGYAEVYIYDWTAGKSVTRGQVRALATQKQVAA